MQITAHWEILIPAVLLVACVVPQEAADEAEASLRDAERPTVRSLVRSWRNWLDLVRSCGGAVLLQTAFVSGHAGPDDLTQESARIRAGILLAGTLLQTLRWSEGLRVYAPVFYLSGLTPLLSGPGLGGFATLFGWLFVLGASDVRLLLPLQIVLLGAAAYLFGELGNHWILLNLGLCALPLVLAAVAGRIPRHVCSGLRRGVPSFAATAGATTFRNVPSDADQASAAMAESSETQREPNRPPNPESK
jgi:hypothetical protein